ncbi:MAG: glycosyltransferase family 4 protein [Actinobacteria bacterium]|nr:glycosyltransferase family 4 protein [Actinomycetota bacterium]
MRIALLPSAYAPAVGGVEVLTARLASHLVTRGHEVEIWTSRSAGDGLQIDEHFEGLRVRRFVFHLPRTTIGSLLSTPAKTLNTLRGLRRAVLDFRPDVLHVLCFSGNGAYAAALSKLAGIPLVVTLQGETVMDDQDIYTHSTALRASLRCGLRRAARVTGCTSFVLDDARHRFGLKKTDGVVIFNGVESTQADVVSSPIPFERYVLAVGRVVHNKGFDLLLAAFRSLADEFPDVGLVLGGEGSVRESLIQQTASMSLSRRVFFPGRLSQEEVFDAMRRAEAFVLPSRVEPFGIVVLEAWRAGVPVLVTSRGGVGEFVRNGVSGLVVDPFDVQSLASSLRQLLNSAALRTKLSQGGTASLPRFYWSRLVREYEDVYRSVT